MTASESREYAERIFTHYFRHLWEKADMEWHGDHDAEIGGAVDAIINAARVSVDAAVLEDENLRLREQNGEQAEQIEQLQANLAGQATERALFIDGVDCSPQNLRDWMTAHGKAQAEVDRLQAALLRIRELAGQLHRADDWPTVTEIDRQIQTVLRETQS